MHTRVSDYNQISDDETRRCIKCGKETVEIIDSISCSYHLPLYYACTFVFCWVNIEKIIEAYECSLKKMIGISPDSCAYTHSAPRVFTGGSTAFNFYLVSFDQTTCEYILNDGLIDNHNLGLLHNWNEFFFSTIPSSKVDFRAIVGEDSAALSVLRSVKAEKNIALESGMKQQTTEVEETRGIIDHSSSKVFGR